MPGEMRRRMMQIILFPDLLDIDPQGHITVRQHDIITRMGEIEIKRWMSLYRWLSILVFFKHQCLWGDTKLFFYKCLQQ